MQSQNHFPKPNWHTLDFLHPMLLCRITNRAPLEMLSNSTLHIMFWMKISKTQQNNCGSAQHFSQYVEAKKPLHSLIPALDWLDILIGSGGCYYFILIFNYPRFMYIGGAWNP